MERERERIEKAKGEREIKRKKETKPMSLSYYNLFSVAKKRDYT